MAYIHCPPLHDILHADKVHADAVCCLLYTVFCILRTAQGCTRWDVIARVLTGH